MRRARAAGTFIALCVLTACAGTMPTPPAEPIDDTQIVPYSRIGKLALGMTEAMLFKAMGEPEKTHCIGTKKLSEATYACEGDNTYVYQGGTLFIGFSKGRAYYVETTSSRYATADGVSVGASDLRMRAAWGTPTKTRELGPCGDPACDTIDVETYEYCFKNGLQADIDADTRKVRMIGVRVSGCGLP